MYPVGVLFGMGFDTASEMYVALSLVPPLFPLADGFPRVYSSLLGVSALASGRHQVAPGQIILLPLLFTAGMSAVDSLDSVFMLSAYTVPARSHAAPLKTTMERVRWWKRKLPSVWEKRESRMELLNDEKEMRVLMAQDQDKLLSMSVVLTVISIVVALLISIVSSLVSLVRENSSDFIDADSIPLFFATNRLSLWDWLLRSVIHARKQRRTIRDYVSSLDSPLSRHLADSTYSRYR